MHNKENDNDEEKEEQERNTVTHTQQQTKITKAEIPALVISKGVLVEQNTEQVWLNLSSMGNYSCFHTSVYLGFFTSNSFC